MQETAARRNQTRKNVQEDISTACAAWMLASRTSQARYHDVALELYDRFLKEQVEHDFHISRPFGIVTLEIHKAGTLTGERRDSARRQALERITWFLDRRKNEDRSFDCNITLADTLSVACLARVFPNDAALRAGEIRRAVAALGQRIFETGDLNENANNTASLGICFFEEYEGQHPPCNLRALFDQWIDLGDRPLHCEVSRAEARQLGPDAWGHVEFTNYNGPGNTLQRRLVLTREGILVIVDNQRALAAGERAYDEAP